MKTSLTTLTLTTLTTTSPLTNVHKNIHFYSYDVKVFILLQKSGARNTKNDLFFSKKIGWQKIIFNICKNREKHFKPQRECCTFANVKIKRITTQTNYITIQNKMNNYRQKKETHQTLTRSIPLSLNKVKINSPLSSLNHNFQGVQGDENMQRTTSHTGHSTFGFNYFS